MTDISGSSVVQGGFELHVARVETAGLVTVISEAAPSDFAPLVVPSMFVQPDAEIRPRSAIWVETDGAWAPRRGNLDLALPTPGVRKITERSSGRVLYEASPHAITVFTETVAALPAVIESRIRRALAGQGGGPGDPPLSGAGR